MPGPVAAEPLPPAFALADTLMPMAFAPPRPPMPRRLAPRMPKPLAPPVLLGQATPPMAPTAADAADAAGAIPSLPMPAGGDGSVGDDLGRLLARRIRPARPA